MFHLTNLTRKQKIKQTNLEIVVSKIVIISFFQTQDILSPYQQQKQRKYQ